MPIPFLTNLSNQLLTEIMEPDFSWIYLIVFLAIPLSRIIPRFLARRNMKNRVPQHTQEKQAEHFFEDKSNDTNRRQKQTLKPETKERLVLGELINGANTFEKIQKNIGFDAEELDKILGDLERKDMLMIHKKQGLLGLKIELYPTDKGNAEFYS